MVTCKKPSITKIRRDRERMCSLSLSLSLPFFLFLLDLFGHPRCLLKCQSLVSSVKQINCHRSWWLSTNNSTFSKFALQIELCKMRSNFLGPIRVGLTIHHWVKMQRERPCPCSMLNPSPALGPFIGLDFISELN